MLIVLVLACAWELRTEQDLVAFILGCACFGCMDIAMFLLLFKKTVTTFDAATASVEIRKYSFRNRDPEPRVIPWGEIRDVLAVPHPGEEKPTGVCLLLGDHSLLYLNWFTRERRVRELRDSVASFLEFSNTASGHNP
jgi:hypothetical protein